MHEYTILLSFLLKQFVSISTQFFIITLPMIVVKSIFELEIVANTHQNLSIGCSQRWTKG